MSRLLAVLATLRATRWAIVRAALLIIGVTPAGAMAQDTAAVIDPAWLASRTGAVRGIVRDQAGLPLGDAIVSLDSGKYTAFTSADGRYTLVRIPVGRYTIEARKLGYRPTRGSVLITRDTMLTANIRINKLPQALDAVLVEAEREMNVSGTVTDSLGRPLAGVIVEAIGQPGRVQTDSSGEFVLRGFKPGIYLVQWRKPGYAIAQYGITMEPRRQQRFEVRLGDADKRLITSAELAAVLQVEATKRLSMKGAMAAIVGREELDRFGSIPLDAALRESSGALAYRDVSHTCSMLDGHEVLSTEGKVRIQTANSRRGPSSIGAFLGGFRRDDGAMQAGTEGSAGTQTSAGAADRGPRPSGANWVAHFRTDEVEMVEIYPEGSEHSRTLCGRFPPSSGCSCPPMPSGIVIWLRK